MPNAVAACPVAEPRRSPLLGPFGRKAIRLGKILDIEIGIDVSWLFIFTLVTIALAGRFGTEHTEWTPVQNWASGLVASLIFFSSIVLHELGHSVTSNALGLPVKSITLFIFGGLARLSGRPKRPRDEFLIGVAGPLVSVALGVFYLLIASLFSADSRAGESAMAIFSWLGYVNLMLAGFNLFPGYPLDGGHLLRAAIWASTGKELLATKVTSALGTVFALVLVGFGAISILFLGNGGGLWLVLIGWFLMRASQGSVMQEVLEERLGHVTARDAMSESCPKVRGDATVQELISGPVLQKGLRHFCVEEGSALSGLVTLNEVKSVPPSDRATTRIESIMVPLARLVTIADADSLWTALRQMDDFSVNQLPVMSHGRLIGILTREQLLRVIRNQLDLGASS